MNPKHLLTLPLTLLVFLISPTLTPAADEDKDEKVAEVKEEKSDEKVKDDEAKKSKEEPKLDLQKLTLASWKLLNEDKHKELIKTTQECLKAFQKEADELQKKLKTAKTELGVGAVTEETTAKIHKNNVLNDVAACHLLQAKAYEATGEKKKAIAAYKAAEKLTLGRVWDPQGWFWSPSKAATERLEELK